MNSYLVTYEYSYNEEPGKFTAVVEAESYKVAADRFNLENKPATMVAIKVLPSPETNYTQLKNHVHNTLKLTKEDIREMVHEAVEPIIERKLDVIFKMRFGEEQWTIQRIVDDIIRDKTRDWLWGESETNLEDYIKTEVVKGLLKSVKMKVELVKTNKEATPPNKIRVISRKGVKK